MPGQEHLPISRGRVLRQFEIDGLVFTQAAYAPSQYLSSHSHELTNVSLIFKGGFVETFGGRSEDCEQFSLIVKPAGEVHTDQYGCAGAECLHIEIKDQRLDAMQPFSSVLDRAAHVRGPDLATVGLRIQSELRRMDNASVVSIEGLFFEALAQIVRSGAKQSLAGRPEWLCRAKDFIHEHFTESFSLLCIAQHAEVHPTYLARAFRRHYDCTVGDYLRRLRVAFAMEQLVRGDQPLSDLAVRAGFYDQSHFSHTFKLHTGMTPARFRAEMKCSQCRTKSSRISQDFSPLAS